MLRFVKRQRSTFALAYHRVDCAKDFFNFPNVGFVLKKNWSIEVRNLYQVE